MPRTQNKPKENKIYSFTTSANLRTKKKNKDMKYYN